MLGLNTVLDKIILLAEGGGITDTGRVPLVPLPDCFACPLIGVQVTERDDAGSELVDEGLDGGEDSWICEIVTLPAFSNLFRDSSCKTNANVFSVVLKNFFCVRHFSILPFQSFPARTLATRSPSTHPDVAAVAANERVLHS